MISKTVDNLSVLLQNKKADGFIISNQDNIFYLTGFRGICDTSRESMIFFDGEKMFLILSPMYYNFDRNDKIINEKKMEVVFAYKSFLDSINNILSRKKREKLLILFEENDVSYQEYFKIKSKLKIRLKRSSLMIEKIRNIKTKEEITRIRKTVEISSQIYMEFLSRLRLDSKNILKLTELDLVTLLLEISHQHKVDGFAFAPIVATGRNSANPHHKAGFAKIKEGPLLLDFGFNLDGYLSDISRTIYLGCATEKFIDHYQKVFECNRICIEGISPNESFLDIHNRAVEHFKKDKLQDFFIHSIGHGIGIQAHELPFVKDSKNMKLQKGQIVTIEPGLYFKNNYGIRIEDMVLVCKDKYSLLTESISKDLVEIKI